jgi:hypothetical protein
LLRAAKPRDMTKKFTAKSRKVYYRPGRYSNKEEIQDTLENIKRVGLEFWGTLDSHEKMHLIFSEDEMSGQFSLGEHPSNSEWALFFTSLNP